MKRILGLFFVLVFVLGICLSINVFAISAFTKLEAESNNANNGVQTESCSEGGSNVGYINNGDWIKFNGVDFGTGATRANFRVASNTSGGTIELRLNSTSGSLVGTAVVSNTGGWQSWNTVSCDISQASGVNDLYIVFKGGSGYLFNLNWLQFTPSQTSSGRTFYVSSNGNDNNQGTEAAPFKTIQKAASTVAAGDQVFIKRGIYNNDVIINTSGTAEKWITFDAYPGDELQVVLDGGSFKIKSSYFRVSGIKVQNSNNGFYVEGPGVSNIEISRNHTYNSFSSGIVAWGVPWGIDPAGYNHINNLKIINNKVQKACNGGWNECITIAQGVVDFVISENEVYDGGNPINGGEGIDVKFGCNNGIVANNYVHNLTRRGIYLDAGGLQKYQKPSVSNVKVYNNIVHDCVGHGIAVMTEGTGDAHDIDIFNNVLYNNTDDGIMCYKHPTGTGLVYNIRAYNNTIYGNKRYGILLAFPGSYGMEFYNNICYANINKNFNVSAGSFTERNNIFNSDPKFVNALNHNFHLQQGSPAIDAGISTNAPINDIEGNRRVGAVDIGAYEFHR